MNINKHGQPISGDAITINTPKKRFELFGLGRFQGNIHMPLIFIGMSTLFRAPFRAACRASAEVIWPTHASAWFQFEMENKQQ